MQFSRWPHVREKRICQGSQGNVGNRSIGKIEINMKKRSSCSTPNILEKKKIIPNSAATNSIREYTGSNTSI